MSKVVRSVARGIGRVVKGVVKAVGKIAKSPIGKILLGVGLSMIGGPVIAGALKGAASGSGFLGTLSGALSGAAQGFGAAVSGIGNAVGTMATGNIGGGFGQLMQGASSNFDMGGIIDNAKAAFGGAPGMGDNLVGAAGQAAEGNMVGGPSTSAVLPPSAQTSAISPVSSAVSPSEFGAAAPYSTPIMGDEFGGAAASTYPVRPPGGGKGILERALEGIEKYKLGPSMVTAGGQMLAGAFQGKALEDQRKWEERQKERDLARMYDSYKLNWRVGPDGRYYAA